ncbi:MAG: ATP-binding protein [Bacteroidetes bacterium]|nr:MAG: ATP-binding protein [Bacteroidota bacterium]
MDNKTKIGKDVIESLTTSMYDDHRSIYREYIQNSADQIDIAFEQGFIKSKEEGKIEIKINKNERSISIYDNGTGIPHEKVLPILKNIAQGVKDRAKHKGFRGIGRLGGLGYCDKLVFETSYYGETEKSILTWDAKQLRTIFNDRSKKEDAIEVIDTITSLKIINAKAKERYFKVTLENVSNDILLDKDNIHNYLSMIAPVPYKKGFFYENDIYEKAKEYDYSIDEYNTYLNNNQIFKEYTTSVYEGDKQNNKKKIDQIFDIDFFEIRNSYNELLCWGWFSNSKLKQQMPEINIARGLRLRKGNIQIGDENRLADFFVINNIQDKRFSFYFFGEIFAVSTDLIPNARRDNFIENKVFKKFEKELRIEFKKLKDFCYLSSNIRSEERKIEKLSDAQEEFKKKIERGFTKPAEKKEYEKKLEKISQDAINAREKIEKIKSKVSADESKKKLVDKLVSEIKEETVIINNDVQNNKIPLMTDNLPNFNRKDRKLTGRILSIIDTVLPKELAETVKQKIIEELNK